MSSREHPKHDQAEALLVSARTWGFKSPLRHQPLAYQVSGHDHEPLGGLVDPLDAELVVQRRAPAARTSSR